MAPSIRRRPKSGARRTRGPGGVRGLRARFDLLVDAVGPRALRARIARYQRWIGLTRSGAIAIVGAIGLWVAAFIVAGKAMYLFAYGLGGFVFLAFFLAPRKLRLEGDRA